MKYIMMMIILVFSAQIATATKCFDDKSGDKNPDSQKSKVIHIPIKAPQINPKAPPFELTPSQRKQAIIEVVGKALIESADDREKRWKIFKFRLYPLVMEEFDKITQPILGGMRKMHSSMLSESYEMHFSLMNVLTARLFSNALEEATESKDFNNLTNEEVRQEALRAVERVEKRILEGTERQIREEEEEREKEEKIQKEAARFAKNNKVRVLQNSEETTARVIDLNTATEFDSKLGDKNPDSQKSDVHDISRKAPQINPNTLPSEFTPSQRKQAVIEAVEKALIKSAGDREKRWKIFKFRLYGLVVEEFNKITQPILDDVKKIYSHDDWIFEMYEDGFSTHTLLTARLFSNALEEATESKDFNNLTNEEVRQEALRAVERVEKKSLEREERQIREEEEEREKEEVQKEAARFAKNNKPRVLRTNEETTARVIDLNEFTKKK